MSSTHNNTQSKVIIGVDGTGVNAIVSAGYLYFTSVRASRFVAVDFAIKLSLLSLAHTRTFMTSSIHREFIPRRTMVRECCRDFIFWAFDSPTDILPFWGAAPPQW